MLKLFRVTRLSRIIAKLRFKEDAKLVSLILVNMILFIEFENVPIGFLSKSLPSHSWMHLVHGCEIREFMDTKTCRFYE
jgi:hypothetical protein